MSPRWREVFTSKLEAAAGWDRWDFVALALALFIFIWTFAVKLKTFYDLGYSGDLFLHLQDARSWLEGRGLLQDNCVGNMLAVHTLFLLVPLGLIAKPFGAPGLLFVLAVFAGATYFWATRVLRILGVDGRLAVITAGVLLISPLSVGFFQDAGHGFHAEILVPALCLMLLYFLLRQEMMQSIMTALVIISVKEDAPITAAIVAIIAGIETWLSSPGKSAQFRFNWPALVTLIISLSAIPVLLAISWSQQPTTYAHHSLDRLGLVAPGTLSSPVALFRFVASNLAHWLGSSVVLQWLWLMVIGTFGTILLRPYYLIVGVPTTLVAWLVNRSDFMWAPRFFSAETLVWCVTLIGFASIARTVSHCSKSMRIAVLTGVLGLAALSTFAQLAFVPWFVRGAYVLHSTSRYSSSEQQEADELFARYRREGKPEEPVVASSMLFRYAHDRNLFWLNRLQGRPAPIWILGDTADPYPPLRITPDTIGAASGIRVHDYVLLERRGRFVLLRKRE